MSNPKLDWMPTAKTLPRLGHNQHRTLDDFLRISLIPRDDADLKNAAITAMSVRDRDNDGTENVDDKVIKELLFGLSEYRAYTPGGIAWKLATVLDAIQENDGEWAWPRHLLQSAVLDAIELERERNEAVAGLSMERTA